MTIPTSGQLKFTDIEEEFGINPPRSLGAYRITDSYGTISPALPLDTGIPTSGTIKFSDFYGKKLNIIVDCYEDGNSNYNFNAYSNAFNVGKFDVIGNFKTKSDVTKSKWNGGKRVIININKTFGSVGASNRNHVAFDVGRYNNNVNQTGWPSTTDLSVVLGSSAYVAGKGGNGGRGGWVGDTVQVAGNGGEGTSAMKIHSGMSITGEESSININNHIIAGGGGGAGGYGGDSTYGGNDEGVHQARASGGAGGGGAGLPGGSGGSPPTDVPHRGSDGTLTSGGNGGDGERVVISRDEDGSVKAAAHTADGGDGGGNGQAGGNGAFGSGWGFDNREESGQEIALGGNGGFQFITY